MNEKTIFITCGKVSQVLISFLTLKIATVMLSKVEMGNLYLLYSIITFFSMIFISPVGQYVNRQIHLWNFEKGISSKFLILYLYFFLSSGLCFFSVLLFGSLYDSISSEVLLLSAVACSMSLFFNSWVGTTIPTLNLLGHWKSFVVLSTLNLLSSLLFAYFFVEQLEPLGVYWVLGRLVVGQLFFSVLAAWYLQKKIESPFFSLKEKLGVEELRAVKKFAFPLVPVTVFMWIVGDSYRFIVGSFIDLSSIALLGVGLAVSGSIMSAVETITHQIFLPDFYQKISSKDIELRAKALQELVTQCIPLYVITAIYVTFMAPYLIKVLSSDAYLEASILVSIGVWVHFIRMCSNILSLVAHSEKDTKSLIIPYFIGAIALVVGCFAVSMFFFEEIYIIFSLILGNIIILISLYLKMNRFVIINFRVLKDIRFLLASFFALSFFLLPFRTSTLFCLIIVFFFGIYYLFLINLFYGKNK